MEKVRKFQAAVHGLLCRIKWEAGQTTAEYALVLLAAAAVAVVLINWASGNDTLTEFFDAVVGKLRESLDSGGSAT